MTLRDNLLRIQRAALEAVDAGAAVWRALCCDDDRIRWRGGAWFLHDVERVRLLAVGKAAPAMAEAAVRILGDTVADGLVVTKHGHAADYALPARVRVFEAGHPVPDVAGLRAAQEVVSLLETTTARDRILLLLSGGGSALLPLPVASLSLEALQETTALLLRAGATIGELNTVRKHLSQLKGGQLARLAAPAPLTALILSDVIGDALDTIASGPTAPDPTTYAKALAVLSKYDLRSAVPATVRAHLEAGAAGRVPETPKPDDALFDDVQNVVLGSNRVAAWAAVARAEQLGYRTLLLSTLVEGEAREVAKMTSAMVKSVRYYGEPVEPPACLIWGGETTVTVRGEGQGGRNQEFALAAALALAQVPDFALMALATDGTDGPTDAAGAIIDGETVRVARLRGLDPEAALLDNDAYPLLDACGALLRTGPTGTNVNDLVVVLVQ